jgi:hypothetical protein
MDAKSKPQTRGAALRKRGAKAPRSRARRTVRQRDAWEQTAGMPEEFDGEIDCQRIVQGEAGRSLPVYYDEYN